MLVHSDDLSLTLVAHVEGRDGAGTLVGNLDGTILLLVSHDVLLQGTEQTLGMFRSQDDTALHLCLGHTWQYACEVDDEIAAGVSDDGEVCIVALCYVGGQFNLELSGLRDLVLFVYCFFVI